MKQTILSLVVICMLISNAFAAGALVEKKEDGKLDLTTVDKTKEKATEITSKDAAITGKVTVTDTDVSKYKVEKKSSTEISISKIEAKDEHTKSIVTVPKSELDKIDIDKDKIFGCLWIGDNGQVWHTTYTESELVSGVEMVFSTNIVNGYSGYKQYTFSSVTSGQTLNIDDVNGAYTIGVAIDGVVPTYTAGIPTDGLVGEWLFNDNYNDTSGNNHHGTAHGNVSIANGYLIKNGTNGFVDVGVVPLTGNTGTMAVKMKPDLSGNVIIFPLGRFWTQHSIYINHLDAYGTRFNDVSITTSAASNDWESSIVTYYGPSESNQITMYQSGEITGYGNLTGNITNEGESWHIGDGGIDNSFPFNGQIDSVHLYSIALNQQHARQLAAGGSGISVRPVQSSNYTGYNVASGVEKVIDTDATCTGIEYIDTTGGTHNVTVTVYFTEDTTLLSETVQDGFYQNGVWHPSLLKVSMEYTPLNNMSSGTITYEYNLPANSTSAYVDELTSTDSGASASINSTHLTVHTTTLTAGQTYTYDTYIAFVYDSYEDEPNAMYRTSNALAGDIDAAFLLAGILFTVCIGAAILGLLGGLAVGRVDIPAAVTSIGILVIGEIFIVIGIIVISAMFGGLI